MVIQTSTPTVVVSHASALRAIRYTRCRYGCLPWRKLSAYESNTVLRQATANARDLDEAELIRAGCWDGHDRQTVEVLIPERRAQRSKTGIKQHVCSHPIPDGSLCEIAANLYSVSPELVVLQLATAQNTPVSCALITELCASFSLKEAAQSSGPAHSQAMIKGYRESEPALTCSQLMKYLKTAQGMPGRRRASTAARYALGGALSPMEAITAILFHMPCAYGGFHLPLILNQRIDFSEDARTVSGMSHAICDAYVPGARSTIEYNGSYHNDPHARLHDERRKLGLAAMGIETFCANSEQLRDVTALEIIARMLYQRMGKRYRNRVAGYRVKQVELLNELRRAFRLPPC